MATRYRLTSQARDDVLGIWEHIASENLKGADQMVDRFTQTFELLAGNPGMGTSQGEYRPGLRCFSVRKTYLIFFTPTDDGIEMYRVLHGARQWENLL